MTRGACLVGSYVSTALQCWVLKAGRRGGSAVSKPFGSKQAGGVTLRSRAPQHPMDPALASQEGCCPPCPSARHALCDSAVQAPHHHHHVLRVPVRGQAPAPACRAPTVVEQPQRRATAQHGQRDLAPAAEGKRHVRLRGGAGPGGWAGARAWGHGAGGGVVASVQHGPHAAGDTHSQQNNNEGGGI